MALVQQGWELQVTYAGSDGKETKRYYEMGPAVTSDAEAQTAASAMLVLINAVTDCVLTGYTIVKRFVENAVSYPAGNVMVQDNALITVNLSNIPNKSGILRIPGAAVGIFQGTTGAARRRVDLADADLVAFVNAFNAGGNFRLSDGEYYSGIEEGRRVTVKDNARTS